MPTALALPGWGTPATRMAPICDGLASHGIAARPWRYDPVGSIRTLGAQLARAVAEFTGPVHLVGHSLGGLVAASAVLHHDADVATVTTVNSPWRGTWAAWTAHPHDPLGQELRWGSDVLEGLRAALAAHLDEPRGPRWSVLSAAGDLAVPITGSTRVPSGDRLATRILPVSGHSVSLLHERTVAAVAERVAGVPA